jgi:hypothetical protein
MEGVGQQDQSGGEGIRVVQEVEHEQHGEEGHVQAAPYGEITTKVLEIRIFRIEQSIRNLPNPNGGRKYQALSRQ